MRVISSFMKLGRFSLSANFPINVSHGNWRLARAVWGIKGYGTDSDSSRPISRYPVPYKKDLPYDIVELMEEVEKKSGFLPNVFKVLAHRPSEFRAFFAYYDVIMNKETGNLTKADRELIIVATSASNKCPYCVTAHSALHRIYSKQRTLADQVVLNPDLADLSKRQRAMLEFALAIAKPENITESQFQKLEEHGFDREDAWDIAMVTGFFALANRIAHLTDLRPNEEFYTLGRIPREKSNEK
ncbi:PREDICTED: uncharacterized protein LOC108785907 [Nanorana parkeri]|uniref:uncharacterized protein LOC108785907 n=1 Tax=Nanorana parkeri TaxID=125878 RepID=UPI000854A438|nr:PREDICTED: uncharacterized protein LOC108785907 [Nanorana parkeri]